MRRWTIGVACQGVLAVLLCAGLVGDVRRAPAAEAGQWQHWGACL